MAQVQEIAPVTVPRRETATEETDTLVFITSDGERIVLDDSEIRPGDAAPLLAEEALGSIWNRPAEDVAWRDM